MENPPVGGVKVVGAVPKMVDKPERVTVVGEQEVSARGIESWEGFAAQVGQCCRQTKSASAEGKASCLSARESASPWEGMTERPLTVPIPMP